MTLDEITSTLKSPDLPPEAALAAGLAKADELAPAIYTIADKVCRGVYLLPAENELLVLWPAHPCGGKASGPVRTCDGDSKAVRA
jgi:hypothetical protein